MVVTDIAERIQPQYFIIGNDKCLQMIIFEGTYIHITLTSVTFWLFSTLKQLCIKYILNVTNGWTFEVSQDIS